MGGAMLRGHVVDDDGRGLADVEAVSDAAGEIDGVMEPFGELVDLVLAVGWGSDAEVESHVADRSGGAIDELGVIAGGDLEVHASKDVFMGGGVKDLGEIGVKSVFLESRPLNRFDKESTIIVEGGKLDHVAASQLGCGKLYVADRGWGGLESGVRAQGNGLWFSRRRASIFY